VPIAMPCPKIGLHKKKAKMAYKLFWDETNFQICTKLSTGIRHACVKPIVVSWCFLSGTFTSSAQKRDFEDITKFPVNFLLI
jgi:hypothetical protein